MCHFPQSDIWKRWLDHFSCWLTSEHSEEAEHDRVEEAEAHGQGVLVDDGGHDEDREHGSCPEFPLGQLEGLDKDQERGGFTDQDTTVDTVT